MEFCDFPIIRGEKELPLFLGNMGQWVRQDHMIRPEGLSVPRYSTAPGAAEHWYWTGRVLRSLPAPGYSSRADIPHEYYPNGDMWDIHWVVPAGYAAEDILRQFGLDRPKISELRDVGTLEHIFRKMHDAIRADSIFGNYRASGFLYDFLIEYYRQISCVGASPSYSPALAKAVDHINSAFRSEITLEELSGISGRIPAAPVPAVPQYSENAPDGIHRPATYPGGKGAAHRNADERGIHCGGGRIWLRKLFLQTVPAVRRDNPYRVQECTQIIMTPHACLG